jgi:hypothetical protein
MYSVLYFSMHGTSHATSVFNAGCTVFYVLRRVLSKQIQMTLDSSPALTARRQPLRRARHLHCILVACVCTVRDAQDSTTLKMVAAVADHRKRGRSSRHRRQLMARAHNFLEEMKQKKETKLIGKCQRMDVDASRGNAAGAIGVVNRMPTAFPTPHSTSKNGFRMGGERRARQDETMVSRTRSVTPMCSAGGGPKLT